jgi:hypothetical protein
MVDLGSSGVVLRLLREDCWIEMRNEVGWIELEFGIGYVYSSLDTVVVGVSWNM